MVSVLGIGVKFPTNDGVDHTADYRTLRPRILRVPAGPNKPLTYQLTRREMPYETAPHTGDRPLTS